MAPVVRFMERPGARDLYDLRHGVPKRKFERHTRVAGEAVKNLPMKAAVPATLPVGTGSKAGTTEGDDENIKDWLRSSHCGEEGGTVLASNFYGHQIDSVLIRAYCVYIRSKTNRLYSLCEKIVMPKLKRTADFPMFGHLLDPKLRILAVFTVKRLGDFFLRYEPASVSRDLIVSVMKSLQESVLYIIAETLSLLKKVGPYEGRMVYQYMIDKIVSYIDAFGMDGDILRPDGCSCSHDCAKEMAEDFRDGKL